VSRLRDAKSRRCTSVVIASVPDARWRCTRFCRFAVSCRTMETVLDHLGDAQEVQVEVTNGGVTLRAHHYGPPLGGEASFREDLTSEPVESVNADRQACPCVLSWRKRVVPRFQCPFPRFVVGAARAHLESSVSIQADDLDALTLSADAESLETDADGNPVVSFITTLREIRAVVDFCRSPAVDIGKVIFYFDSVLGSPILVSSGSETGLPLPYGSLPARFAQSPLPPSSLPPEPHRRERRSRHCGGPGHGYHLRRGCRTPTPAAAVIQAEQAGPVLKASCE
jgi:hypothetical protein